MSNPTLDDLIKAGARAHNERKENERKAQEEERARRAVAEAAVRRQVLALLPDAVRPITTVHLPSHMRAANIIIQLPGKGRVEVCAYVRDGEWRLLSPYDYYQSRGIVTYAATNPDGYSHNARSLEEALAYAAGVINP